ncbi:MAG: hypothetical protein ACI9OJ_001582, partial [Myxococcota bacterium]
MIQRGDWTGLGRFGVILASCLAIGCPEDSDTDTGSTDDAVEDAIAVGDGVAGNDIEDDLGQVDTDGTDVPPDVGPDVDDTGPALPSCEDYCDAVNTACTADNAQYADNAACLAYCVTWGQLPKGTLDDTAGNTVGCRMYHAGVASGSADDAAIHCVHAGPTGGDVCGAWCENYCHLADTNCGGDNAIAWTTDCMADCSAYVDDQPAGATAGDSAQCRIYHLGVAGSDGDTSAATHCPHGAPDGGGVCVDLVDPTCANYCTTVTDACTGDNAQYADEAACLSYCNVGGQLPLGDVSDTAGNTVGCRSYHAGVAAGSDDDAGIHCPHAGPTGGDVCGTWCDNYCHLSATNCSADNELFADDATCNTACDAYETDANPGSTAGDSVQCRIYHLGVAGSDGDTSAVVHCPHGDVDGGDVCVAAAEPTCADYCAAITTSCTGDNAQYDSENACLAYCSDWAAIPPGTVDDTAGNTVGCRIYHAGVAGTDDASADLHCVHAGPSGGDVCGGWCDNYCQLSGKNCAGADELFADDAECATACAAFPTTGTAGDTDGGSVQCKIYHLGVAGVPGADSAPTHCPHADIDGGGVCVGPTVPTCADYCTAVTAACSGDNAQYDSMGACLAYCADWATLPTGTLDDTAGNTVGCRIYHAGVASTDDPSAAIHCVHAGPSGGNVCGSWCENYCQLSGENCTDTNELYADEPTCLTACGAFPAGGESGDTAGDSVQCKIYHLGVAGVPGADSASTHCPHGAVDGGVCVAPEPLDPTCTEYCTAVTANCAGEFAQYADMSACMAYCGTWAQIPVGTAADTSGNTVGCRTYHAGVAGTDGDTSAAVHCAHAGPSGGNVCGTWCDNYCQLSDTNCDGPNELFVDVATCATACAAYDDTGDAGDAAGGTVQCKIYHLGVAGSDGATSATTHCPHGDVDGGGVCVAPVVDPTCTEYCTAVTANCTDQYTQYADMSACMAYCGTWAQIPVGTAADTSGNTVGCRTYHAGVAGTDGDTSAAVHCGHAGPSGGNVCGTWCDNYCQLSATNCDGQFADAGACTTACGAYDDTGDAGDTGGDSVQCKIYHLGVAGSDGATSAATHCPHGDVDGGGVCVAPVVADPSCTEYCTAVTANCTDGNAQYADMDACMAYCGTWAQLPVGTAADTSGNTVGCRTYHAGVAGTDGDTSAAVHCAHAGPTGGDVCGTWCENYCQLSATNCDGQFAADAECATACAAYETSGDPGDTSGDTVHCKIYHLGVAGSDGATSAATHCPHGAVDGGGVCAAPAASGDDCASPLALTVGGGVVAGDSSGLTDTFSGGVNCSGAFLGTDGAGVSDQVLEFTVTQAGPHIFTFDDLGNGSGTATYLYLLSACVEPTNPTGSCVGNSADLVNGGTWTIDSLSAGTYYLVVDGAVANEAGAYEVKIDFVAPDPTCTEYCTAVMANCTDGNAQYADMSACLAYCGTWAQLPLGDASDTSGNTV